MLIDKLEELNSLGVTSINLSLDSLDPERFFNITRRDSFQLVMDCLERMISMNFQVKINMVVMSGQNTEDILPMIELTRDKNLSVRFIEEMPFNGTKGQGNQGFWSHIKMLDHISQKYPNIQKLQDGKNATAKNYQIDGFLGNFGIIAAYSRTFCGSCNRIRLTPQGILKTCLYDHGVFNIKTFMREGASDAQLLTAIQDAIQHKAKDGFEAEEARKHTVPVSESMATIGG